MDVSGSPPWRSVDVATGALRLHCVVWGDDRDPLVILVHGNGAHAHWWDTTVTALVPGYRVVAPDLRGHGESAWPAEPAYRLADYAGDIEAVVHAFAPSGPFVVVGHSMGARVALHVATTFAPRVAALGFVDTRLDAVDPAMAERFRGRVSAAGRREGPGYPSYADAVAAFRFVPPEKDVPPALVAHLAHYAVRERGPADWTFRFDRAALGMDGDGGGDMHDVLRRVTCPLFLAASERSWLCDAGALATMAACVPDAERHLFPGRHHFLIAQGPALGLALRRFLDSRYTART